MSDQIAAPKVTLDNDDPSLRDQEVRAFLDAETDKAAALFAQIGETSDEREQMQRYSDALVVVYPAGFLATRALLVARSMQVQKLLDLNDEAHQSLAKSTRRPCRLPVGVAAPEVCESRAERGRCAHRDQRLGGQTRFEARRARRDWQHRTRRR
jgi:hypothetical protein